MHGIVSSQSSIYALFELIPHVVLCTFWFQCNATQVQRLPIAESILISFLAATQTHTPINTIAATRHNRTNLSHHCAITTTYHGIEQDTKNN